MGLFVHYAVVELGEFGFVPALGGAHEVTSDALQLIDRVASAARAGVERSLGIFVAAIHAAVAVVVD